MLSKGQLLSGGLKEPWQLCPRVRWESYKEFMDPRIEFSLLAEERDIIRLRYQLRWIAFTLFFYSIQQKRVLGCEKVTFLRRIRNCGPNIWTAVYI